MAVAKMIDNSTTKLWGNSARNEFFKHHFPAKGGLSGQIIIVGKDFKRVRFERAGAPIADFVQKVYIKKQQYYTTINTFSGGKHDTEHLFALNNLYIDIDVPALHQQEEAVTDEQYEDMMRLYDTLCLGFDWPSDLPRPSTVVYTGRGFGLWFALNQASYKLLGIWQACAREISRRISGWIADLGLSDQLQVDVAASTRAAGLARLPGSWNPIARRWGYFTPAAGRSDLLELAGRLGLGYIRQVNADNKVVPLPAGGGVACLGLAARATMLEQLRDLRKEDGSLYGCRDELNFCYYCTCIPIYGDNMDKVEEFNALMGRYALPTRRLVTYMSTASRKHYTLSDREVVERIGLTNEEMELIGWHPSEGGISVRSQRKIKKQEKERRNADIIKRVAAGEKQTDLAREYGINKSTVSRIVKAAELAAQEEEQKEVKEVAPTTTTENVIKFDIPRLTAAANRRRGSFAMLFSQQNRRRPRPLDRVESAEVAKPVNEYISLPAAASLPPAQEALPHQQDPQAHGFWTIPPFPTDADCPPVPGDLLVWSPAMAVPPVDAVPLPSDRDCPPEREEEREEPWWVVALGHRSLSGRFWVDDDGFEVFAEVPVRRHG